MRDRLFAPDSERNSPSYGYEFMISALAEDRAGVHESDRADRTDEAVED
jgi:hypothetical protein